MGAATREYFLATFRDTMRRIDESGIDYLLIGSLATSVVLGDDWDPASDVDLFVRKEGAEAVLEPFSAAGYAVHWRDPTWIVKVAKPNVTVDLIFCAGDQRVRMDEQHLARATWQTFEDVRVRVAAREDLAVIKALFDSEERNGQWYDAVRLLESGGTAVDWDYVADRGLQYDPYRLTALLLYLESLGVDVDAGSLARLAKAAVPDR